MYFFVIISSLALGLYMHKIILNVESGKGLVFKDLFYRAMGWSGGNTQPDNTVEEAWGYTISEDDYERFSIEDPTEELPKYDLIVIKYWFGKKLYKNHLRKIQALMCYFPIYEDIKHPKVAGRGILSATIGKREDDKSNIDVTSYISECLGPKKNFYKDKGFEPPLLSSLRLHGKIFKNL